MFVVPKFCVWVLCCVACLGALQKVAAQADSTKQTSVLILPIVLKSLETDWSFGAAYVHTFRLHQKDSTTRTSNAELLGLYSLKKQLVLAINGSQYFKNERYILNEQISYSSFPDKCWGLGNNTPDSMAESYTFKQFYIYGHLLRKLGRKWFVGGLFEYQNVFDVDYTAGGIFDRQKIAGRTPYKVVGLGGSLTFDNRENAFNGKGSFLQLYFNHFNPIFGSDFTYTNMVLDARKFWYTYKQQLLGVQLYAFGNIGEFVPLRSLASFGGSNKMRGYYGGRYRENQMWVLQTEYRLPVYKRFGLAAFAGMGDVARDLKGFRLSDIKYSYGAGLRYALNKKERLNLRIDYGIGQNNNNGVYLQIGEAF